MNDESTLYLCDCGCGAIAIETSDMGDGDKLVCLSLWRHGVGGHRASWRDRLEYIWHIVRHGHPYTDTVLLKPEQAHRLGIYLCCLARELVKLRVERPKRKPVAPVTVVSKSRRKPVAPSCG
jgi:hypothetical protein